MPVLVPDPWVDVPVTPAYVTLAQLRALPNLADTAKFTDAELATAAVWFENVFEDYTGVAWTPRTVIGERHSGGSSLLLDHPYPRTISAVNVYSDATTYVAYTAAELADLRLEPSGVVRRVTLGGFTSGTGNITVDYVHYKTAVAPSDVVEAAKVAIRAHVLDDYQANRQYAVATEAGIVRTSQPGEDRPFGIPEVDAVANRRAERTIGVA